MKRCSEVLKILHLKMGSQTHGKLRFKRPLLVYRVYLRMCSSLIYFFKHFKKLVSNSCRAPFGNFENVKQIVRSEAESICGR